MSLLFRPFDRRRWIGLSLVCLFLGGGTSTAAFQWGFGALPADLHPSELLVHLRLVMAQHASLIVLAVIASLALVFGLTYVRCVLRFVLIDAVIRQEVAVGAAWKGLKSYGRSYFLWFFGVLGAVLLTVTGAAIGSLRYLAVLSEGGHPWWLAALLIVTELVAVVLIGLMIAILITLTDDLVAPVMYVDKISLPAAWRTVWKIARRDHGEFVFYVVLRFAVGMGISLTVLIVLFPLLMGISSGALVIAALGMLVLRAVGLAWVWNTWTISLAALALCAFTGLLFALLSVVGMPGQVYLQNYGVRFIASRVPSLQALCRSTAASRRWR